MTTRRLARGGEALIRLRDIVVAAVALGVTAPLQLLIAWAIRRDIGSPVLFRQVRPGLDGEPFELVKFRTMLPEDRSAGLTSDGVRLTRLGRRLRATSLDELPSLWNVLKGDMSLVGPRPLLVAYLDRYTSEQARRHDVRPGLTGLSQVRGRNDLPWEEKLRLDVAYVDQRSMLLDLQILLETVGAVITGRGVTAAGHDTTPEFLPARQPEAM